MSSKTSVNLSDRIFNSAELKRALSKLPLQQAQKFGAKIAAEMDESPHTGDIVTKVRGENFRIRHQQSRRGERPAPFSRNLINSLKSKKTGEFSAQMDSDAVYADKLVFQDDRVIVSDQDLAEANKSLTDALNSTIRGFL